MKWNPEPYQTYGVGHILAYLASLLLYEVGLGKTSTTLTAMSELIYERMEVRKALIVCTKAAVESVWVEQMEHWDHLQHMFYSVVVGTEVERVRALNVPAEIYIINQEVLPWLVKHYGAYWDFDMLVLDELAGYKDRNTKRWKAVCQIRPYVERFVGLTATPAPESILDLWPQMYLLDLGERLGKDFEQFKTENFDPEYKDRGDGERPTGRYVPRPGRDKEIYSKIGDVAISVLEKDWLKMPPLITRQWTVQLPREIKAQYDQLERDMLLPLDDGEIAVRSAQSLAGKLLQFSNGAIYDANHKAHEIHAAKLDALGEFMQAANGNPVLCWYWYQHDLNRILGRFPQAVLLSGADELDAWNRREIPLLLAHPQSKGESLNMQAGSHLMGWFTSPWSGKMQTQAVGRLRRMGQRKQVISTHFVARGTLDEEVLARLQDKSTAQNALLEAVKARIRKVQAEAQGS